MEEYYDDIAECCGRHYYECDCECKTCGEPMWACKFECGEDD